jgi:hypothetical protein
LLEKLCEIADIDRAIQLIQRMWDQQMLLHEDQYVTMIEGCVKAPEYPSAKTVSIIQDLLYSMDHAMTGLSSDGLSRLAHCFNEASGIEGPVAHLVQMPGDVILPGEAPSRQCACTAYHFVQKTVSRVYFRVLERFLLGQTKWENLSRSPRAGEAQGVRTVPHL